jgi:hypothetical protein
VIRYLFVIKLIVITIVKNLKILHVPILAHWKLLSLVTNGLLFYLRSVQIFQLNPVNVLEMPSVELFDEEETTLVNLYYLVMNYSSTK